MVSEVGSFKTSPIILSSISLAIKTVWGMWLCTFMLSPLLDLSSRARRSKDVYGAISEDWLREQTKGKKFSLVKTVNGKERRMGWRAGQTVWPRISKETDRPANEERVTEWSSRERKWNGEGTQSNLQQGVKSREDLETRWQIEGDRWNDRWRKGIRAPENG